jgi:hypothetical protein
VAARLFSSTTRQASSAGRLPRLVALVALAAALAGCGASSSKPRPVRLALVYHAGNDVVLARASGADPRTLGEDSQALLSPDGADVLALGTSGPDTTITLYRTTPLHRTTRLPAPRLVAQLDAPLYAPGSVDLLCWSADSRYVALSVNELSATGEQGALIVLDIATGKHVTIATGNFLGASFSPTTPDRLVYSDATIGQLDANESLLYVSDASGGDTRQLTYSGLASAPSWSARAIYYAKLLHLGSPTSAPSYALWAIAPAGRGAHRLGSFASGPPAPSSDGVALSSSATGDRVVGDFSSPGRSVGVWAFSFGRDAQTREISLPGLTIAAAGVSRNGKTILLTASTPTGTTEIVSLTWNGAKQRVLAATGTDPSWNS